MLQLISRFASVLGFLVFGVVVVWAHGPNLQVGSQNQSVELTRGTEVCDSVARRLTGMDPPGPGSLNCSTQPTVQVTVCDGGGTPCTAACTTCVAPCSGRRIYHVGGAGNNQSADPTAFPNIPCGNPSGLQVRQPTKNCGPGPNCDCSGTTTSSAWCPATATVYFDCLGNVL